MNAGARRVEVALKMMLIAWWAREGLQIRPISAAAIRAMLPDVQSNHTLSFRIQPYDIPVLALVYVLKTNYMPRDPRAELGLTDAGVTFLRASVGHFLEDREALSPKHRAALDVIWQRVTIRDTYPYDAHRKFRDCRARDVFDSLHALRFFFDVSQMRWIEKSEEQS